MTASKTGSNKFNWVHHDLKWAFEDDARVMAVREAAISDDGDRTAKVDKVFSASGNPDSTPWNDAQADALRTVFKNDGVELVRPADDRGVLVEALRFWRHLLAMEPDEVLAFTQALGSFNGAPGQFAELKRYFTRMGLDGWTPDHAVELQRFARNEHGNSALNWFGSPGDMW